MLREAAEHFLENKQLLAEGARSFDMRGLIADLMAESDRDAPSLEDACAAGEHELVPDPEVYGARICKHCGLDSGTISDWLGHGVKRS